ncbi:MAG: hypothetical protein IKP68_07470 [Clostridia bacterium]|nr:hypothetical protein [Clostridia bacterium]
MTYDIYRYIFFGGAGLAGLCLIIAVILFLVLRIPSVIGDLTGSTARKAIENIRNQNESSGDKTYKSSAVNRERGKLTDKITPTGTLIKNPTDLMGGAMATTKIGTQQLAAEAQQAYETSLLEDNGSNETTVLSSSGAGETTVLEQTAVEQGADNSNIFVIEYEITFIHTDEVIA